MQSNRQVAGSLSFNFSTFILTKKIVCVAVSKIASSQSGINRAPLLTCAAVDRKASARRKPGGKSTPI